MKSYAAALEALDKAVSLAPPQPPSVRQTLTKLYALILDDRSDTNRRRLARETDDARRQALLDAARSQAKKAKSNYIHLLPRDVLVSIAEQGVAVKMGMVCKKWREVVCSQPGLWNTLSIGKGRAVAKAKIWMERSQGRIKQLKIEEGFDASCRTQLLVEVLGECLRQVKSLILILKEPKGVLEELQGRFGQLRQLVLKLDKNGGQAHRNRPALPDLRLSPPFAHSLRHVELEDFCVNLPLRYPTHQPGARWILASAEILRMSGCTIEGDRGEPIDVMQLSPAALEIEFSHTHWRNPTQASQPVQEEKMLEHKSLTSYKETGEITTIRFKHLKTPNLTSLDFGSSNFPSNVGVLNQILAPGLALALPNLSSLDIGRCALEQVRLLAVLACLPRLKFLNVSFCCLDNAFLAALERKDGQEDLLPHLTALSIAGNNTITAGAVKDLVDSRLPPALRRIPQIRAPPKRTSSFLPSAPSQSQPVTSTPSESDPSPSSTQSPLPSITWLNLDSCERIDHAAARFLLKRVRFVSNVFGAIAYDRVRGKGAWAWDGDWTEKCGNGEENVCQLRKVPGMSSVRNQWELAESCGRRDQRQVVCQAHMRED